MGRECTTCPGILRMTVWRCAKDVLNAILQQVRNARYYPIIVGGTLDGSYTKLVVVICHEIHTGKDGKLYGQERFLQMVDCEKTKGVDTTVQIKFWHSGSTRE